MMVEKEAGIYDKARFPSLWVPFLEYEGRYQHAITKKFVMQEPPPVGGGILADEMGLGKTLSMLSLICHSLDAFEELPAPSRQNVPRATLVVTPKSTIYGWEAQIRKHIQEGKVSLLVYHGQGREQDLHSGASYDVVLTTYDTLRSERDRDGPLFKEKWARVVLDEAHKIRNTSSKVFKAVCDIDAQKRWCLTGTPIHNSLADFGALLSFVRVPPFEKKGEFASLISNPINAKQNGSLDRLRALVAATTLRRTKATHLEALGLGRKTERVETVELSSSDRQLYEFFKCRSYLVSTMKKPSTASKGNKRAGTGGGSSRGSNILILISLLRLICDHGAALLPESAIKARRDNDPSAIDWDMLESGVNKCAGCGGEVESLDATSSTVENFDCGHILCSSCAVEVQGTGASCASCGSSESSQSPPPASQSVSLPAGSNSPRKPTGSPRSPFAGPYVPSDKVEALLRNIDSSGGTKQ